MKRTYSRRNFVQTGALIAAACTASTPVSAFAKEPPASPKPLLFHLGLASYTFRNFSRAQLIAFMKQLKSTALNAKNVKDHLPTDPQEETQAIKDYSGAGIQLHAAGVIYFPTNEDADIRAKFEYCKRAGVSVIVAGGATIATLPRLEQFVREYDMRIAIHNHGPKDTWPSPLDVLKAVKDMDPRMGCCIDVGHTVLAGVDVVRAIREAGPRIFNMHIKDMTDFKREDSEVPVGDGIMPIREIFEALIATEYKGFVDLEYEPYSNDPMPGVIGSLAFMRGVLNGLGYTTCA
jgi:sugar phosphate isomerase/epimerase